MNVGGPAHHVSALNGLLDADRYETLLVAGRLGRGEAPADEWARSRGATLQSVEGLRPELRPGMHDAIALARLAGVIRLFRPDIVHTHTAKAGFLGRLAAAYAVRPRPLIVHTYHGHVLEGYFNPTKNRVFGQLERLAGRMTDALLAVSHETVDDLVRLGIAPPSKFRTVSVGLDLGPFLRLQPKSGEAFRREVGVAPEEVLVTFVARLAPIKRADLALRAVANARRRGAPVRLAVVGDGLLRPDLERLAEELGVADAVRFVGYRNDMPEIAAASDIALLTSDNEALGAALVEAAAAGTPAVATAVGGVSEVVAAGCGLIVPAGDEDALAAALVDLAEDPEVRGRMGAQAREHVRERFSARLLIAQMDDLYTELLARKAASGGSSMPPLREDGDALDEDLLAALPTRRSVRR